MGSLPPAREPLRVAILECDTPAEPIREKYGSFGDMFKRLFASGAEYIERADREGPIEFEWTTYDVVNHEHYPQLENVDAVLLTGSKYNSFDNDPWILRLVEFTQQVLADDRVRLVGVCFGHQIIGRALGIEVGRNEAGWEIAVLPHRLTDKGKQLFGLEELHLHQMHRDIVRRYPTGVDKLADTPRCDVQALYVKDQYVSVQGHPEFNGELVAMIADARHAQGIFTDELYNDAMSRAHKKHDGIAVAVAFIRFLLEK